MKKHGSILLAVILSALMIAACSDTKRGENAASSSGEAAAASQSAATAQTEAETANPVPVGYRQISQAEAQKMMDTEKDYIILDVRTPDEYAEGHIPGAICISHDAIPTDDIPELPRKDQLIMVYCRSGRRSKLAAEQLVAQGYTDVVEFGGVNTWPGKLTTE